MKKLDLKYGKSIIRFQETTFKDKTFIDIRKFYFDEETQENKPTRKGVCIPVTLVSENRDKILSFFEDK